MINGANLSDMLNNLFSTTESTEFSGYKIVKDKYNVDVYVNVCGFAPQEIKVLNNHPSFTVIGTKTQKHPVIKDFKISFTYPPEYASSDFEINIENGLMVFHASK